MNFRRSRPRAAGGARRNDWHSWRSSGVIKRLFRQSGGGVDSARRHMSREEVEALDSYHTDQAMWDRWLEEYGGDK